MAKMIKQLFRRIPQHLDLLSYYFPPTGKVLPGVLKRIKNKD